MIAPQIKGKDHIDPTAALYKPFFVGTVIPEKGWIHVLDDVSLPLILTELDTITDFLDYLSAKESLLLTEGLNAVVAGEENLLGTFLANERTDFRKMAEDLSQSESTLLITDGIWNDYCAKGRRNRRQFLSKDSRLLWDGLIIQDFATHAFQGTLVPGSPPSIADNESLLRILATESRAARAFLTKAMMERCFGSALDRAAFRTVNSPTHPDTLYVFAFTSCRRKNNKQYRLDRRAILNSYLLTVAYRQQKFRRFVGIATELGDFPYRSFDIMVLEVDAWTPELESAAKKCLADLEVTPAAYRPLSRDFVEPSKVGRNDVCPCGSGKKYKRCCLRAKMSANCDLP